jgi:hypothetical protein
MIKGVTAIVAPFFMPNSEGCTDGIPALGRNDRDYGIISRSPILGKPVPSAATQERTIGY